MNHSYFSIRSISKTLVIAGVFALSALAASDAYAGTVQMRVKNNIHTSYSVGTPPNNYADVVRAEPGDQLGFRMLFLGDSAATSITVDFPANLTFVSGSTATASGNAATANVVDSDTIQWTFASGTTEIITFNATVAAGNDFTGADHSIEASFSTNGTPAASDTATITVGPIVTGITPSTGNNLNAVSITSINGHGFAGATAIKLSSDGTTTDHTFDLTGATITDTSISGANIRVPSSFAAGAYWVMVTVTSSGNALTTNADSTETVKYTVDTTPPTATVSYSQNGATLASAQAGDVEITVTFNESIQGTPKIAIDQPGSMDIAAVDLSGSGTVWTYTYAVNAADGPGYVDGTATVSISNALDSVDNAYVGPAANATFTIDTLVPSPAITTFAGTSSGQTAANFSWTPTYSASDFSTYKFYWRTTSGVTSTNGTLIDENTSGYSNLGTSSTASLSISSLSAGTNYYAVIYICDSASNCSSASNEANVRTQDNAVVTAPVSGGGGGAGSASTPTTASSAVSVSSSGGTVSTTLSSGSSASVAIPSGAVSESTSIMVSETTLAEQNSAPLPSTAGTFIGNSIFKMEASSGGTSVTQFSAPLTLTFGYTTTQLGAADASKLRIAYFDTASGVWVALASTVDSANRKVSASTDHFTLFGLIAFVNPPADGSAEGQVLGSTVGVYPNGALLKAPDSPAVWRISSDQKHLIKSAAIFESRFNWDDVITLPSGRQLDLYEQGDDVKFAPATLVKIMGEPAVYRVSTSGDSAPIVSEEVFWGRGYSFGDVIEVESSLLAQYPKIAVIDSSNALYDGDLVKLAHTPAVYYIEGGAARVMPSSSIFHERALKFARVRTISQSQFDALAIGSAMTYPDGTLVKGDASSVYVVADGKKRPIASAADFEALLYRWSNIIYVPESLLAAIPEAGELKLVVAGN